MPRYIRARFNKMEQMLVDIKQSPVPTELHKVYNNIYGIVNLLIDELEAFYTKLEEIEEELKVLRHK